MNNDPKNHATPLGFWLQIYILIESLYEALLVYFGQGLAELWVPKVRPCRDSSLGRPKRSNSLYKLAENVASNPKGLDFFLTANFQRPQYRNRLSEAFELWTI